MKFTVTTFSQREILVLVLTKNLGPFLGRERCLRETWFACQRAGIPGHLGSLWGPQKRTVELELLPKPCDFRGQVGGLYVSHKALASGKAFLLPQPHPCSPRPLFTAPLFSQFPEEEAWFLGTITALLQLLPRNRLSHWWKLRLTEVKGLSQSHSNNYYSAATKPGPTTYKTLSTLHIGAALCIFHP